MPGCCAVGCKNRTEKGHKMFSVPNGQGDKHRRKIWLAKIRRQNFSPRKAYLCADHFEESQFELHRKDGLKKLKPNAVPTLFNNMKSQKPVKTPRSCARKKKNVEKSSSQQSSPKTQNSPSASVSKPIIISLYPCNTVVSSDESVDDEVNNSRSLSRITSQASEATYFSTNSDNTESLENGYVNEENDDLQLSETFSDSDPENVGIKSESMLLTSDVDKEERLSMCIEQLKEENARLSRQVKSSQKAFLALKYEYDVSEERVQHFQKSLLGFLSKEQIERLIQPPTVRPWSAESIARASEMRYAMGTNAYKYLIETGYPFPSHSTLHRHMQKVSNIVKSKEQAGVSEIEEELDIFESDDILESDESCGVI